MNQTRKMMIKKIKLWFETRKLQTGRKIWCILFLFLLLLLFCFILYHVTHNANRFHIKNIFVKIQATWFPSYSFQQQQQNLMYYLQKNCVILETISDDAKTM